MKAYVATTGVLFALLVVAHVWRWMAEGAHVLGDPIFVTFTLLAAVMCGWAVVVFRSIPARA